VTSMGVPWMGFETQVHPRMCGRCTVTKMDPETAAGQSPHVREISACGYRQFDSARSIPACAGDVPRAVRSSVMPPVNPRMCGRDSDLLRLVDNHLGSAPHVQVTYYGHRAVVC